MVFMDELVTTIFLYLKIELSKTIDNTWYRDIKCISNNSKHRYRQYRLRNIALNN